MPGLAIRTANPVQDINIIGSYHERLLIGSPCDPFYHHAGECHRESSVAYALGHFRFQNVVNLMLQLCASWTFRHVAFLKPDSANYPEVMTFQKNIASAIKLLGMLFNCKIVRGHEIIDFLKIIIHSQCARAIRIVVLVSCHGSMISINFNRKVIFYMYKQYSLMTEVFKNEKSCFFAVRCSFVSLPM